MEDLYLTKEEAIAEHRKMWNWIADRLENFDDIRNMFFNTNKSILRKNFQTAMFIIIAFVVNMLNKK